jgi:hypothetical protein
VTETPIRDSFAVEAKAFVAAWDRLKLAQRKNFADLPDAELVRPVIQQAEWIWFQNDNPFRDFTDIDLWTIRLASSFLRWLADPTNARFWDRMFDCRAELGREYPWDWEFDPGAQST